MRWINKWLMRRRGRLRGNWRLSFLKEMSLFLKEFDLRMRIC